MLQSHVYIGKHITSSAWRFNHDRIGFFSTVHKWRKLNKKIQPINPEIQRYPKIRDLYLCYIPIIPIYHMKHIIVLKSTKITFLNFPKFRI